MKALYVLHRIFHYFALWLFILAGLVVGIALFYGSLLGATGEYAFDEVAAITYLLGMVTIGLVVAAILNMAVSHILKEARVLRARKAEREEAEVCECCCCECAKEEKSDLDAQVEEVMKWKNLYVEGIITEREFIDKRNEILRISK